MTLEFITGEIPFQQSSSIRSFQEYNDRMLNLLQENSLYRCDDDVELAQGPRKAPTGLAVIHPALYIQSNSRKGFRMFTAIQVYYIILLPI